MKIEQPKVVLSFLGLVVLGSIVRDKRPLELGDI